MGKDIKRLESPLELGHIPRAFLHYHYLKLFLIYSNNYMLNTIKKILNSGGQNSIIKYRVPITMSP